MGLGKTLQAICIVAGDYQTRKERYKVKKQGKHGKHCCIVIHVGDKGCCM